MMHSNVPALDMNVDRVRLRPYQRCDLDELVAIANDADVARYMQIPYPYTRAHGQALLDHATTAVNPTHLAIEIAGVLAGGVSIVPYSGENAGVAEIGFWLGSKYWGKGLATAAVQAIEKHGFQTLGLRRLEAYVMEVNIASARVLEKRGFVREAILAKWYVDRVGRIHDGLLYGKLRE